MKIIIGSDGSGFPLKEKLVEALQADSYEVKDVGGSSAHEGYYLDAAEPVCAAVQNGEYDRGILVCGTGQGMNISANKYTGIRSALCYNAFTAKMSRADNDANVLCTGAWIVGPDEGINVAKAFLSSDYYDTNRYGLGRIAEFEQTRKKA